MSGNGTSVLLFGPQSHCHEHGLNRRARKLVEAVSERGDPGSPRGSQARGKWSGAASGGASPLISDVRTEPDQDAARMQH